MAHANKKSKTRRSNLKNYYYIRLTAFFQDNLGKPAPERQTILDFSGARDDGVAVASAGPMQIICTSLQTHNHASTSPLSFLQARCPCCRPSNGIKALKAIDVEFVVHRISPGEREDKASLCDRRLSLLTVFSRAPERLRLTWY